MLKSQSQIANIKYLVWSLCATLWATVCFLLPDFLDNPIGDFRTFCTIVAYLAALGAASFFILYLFGLNRYVVAVFLPVFALGGATVSYFRVAFHATITPMVIDATLHTNGGTVAGVVTWPLVVWALVNLLIACGLLFWRWRIVFPNAWAHALAILCLWAAFYFGHSRLHMSVNQRYPYNIVSSFVEYTKQQHSLQQERQTLPAHAVALPDSIDVVFVLGEAIRADHLSLNGYARPTCPNLQQRDNVVSLPHIYTPYTYTSLSVPYILSPADSIHPDWAASYHSFIHTFKQYGFRSAWISNQDNGKTYVSFIHEADTVIFPNASKTSFVFDPWYDEQLLPPLDSQLSHPAARNLFVMHTIGSHWYYNNHVPPQHQYFQPLTANRVITANEPEQVVNSYDNTVRYMDAFLDSLIGRFESRPAIIIYLSDHGEALGENGEWLHAGEADALHKPACIIWYSDRYAQLFPEHIEALQHNAAQRYGTDFLYYSVLAAARLETDSVVPHLNIFAP